MADASVHNDGPATTPPSLETIVAKPLCFVLMPFGRKPASSGLVIDFDAVYHQLIGPAIEAAGLEPIRADEEKAGGIIHKPMYERLILCEYAVADLTNANANVFYELGLRHAVRPHATILMFAEGLGQLPFDVGPLRGLPYRLAPDGAPTDVESARSLLTTRLTAARDRERDVDSPVFQLVENFPDIQRLKTDVFRAQVDYSSRVKADLAAARKLGRKDGPPAIRAIAQSLPSVVDADAGVVIDLFLSFRAVDAWQDMIDLVARMSAPLAATVMVQEQLGFALNRAGRGDEAEQVLQAVIDARGPSSETYGLLGRVYKDRYQAALKAGDTFTAEGELDRAIDAYRRGFDADIRDAYPGINAVTLMELREEPDPRRTDLLPVVTYAVRRRIEAGKPDYWDYATLLELAILRKDRGDARKALSQALPLVRESWEAGSTRNNLVLIREARDKRGETVEWAGEIEAQLQAKSEAIAAGRK